MVLRNIKKLDNAHSSANYNIRKASSKIELFKQIKNAK